jgi:hypothetical protein
LTLKHPTGWFAAGREVAEALMVLPDAAFRLYMYVCLNADRHTGRFVINTKELTRTLGRSSADMEEQWNELRSRGVCQQRADMVEICDRFWPYQKRLVAQPEDRQAEYVRRVKQAFLEPACVCSSFAAADEKLAIEVHVRGVPLETVERAVWLGCARKYAALLNGPPGHSRSGIASLAYFTALLEEVAQAPVSDAYWHHVRRKMQLLERQWLHASSAASAMNR